MATFNIELTASVKESYLFCVDAYTEEEARDIAREWALEAAKDDLDIYITSV